MISQWLKKHTKEGHFKQVPYARFQRSLPKHLFRNQANEAGCPSKGYSQRVPICFDSIDPDKPFRGENSAFHEPDEPVRVFFTETPDRWTSSIREVEPAPLIICPAYRINSVDVGWARPLEGIGGGPSEQGLKLCEPLRRPTEQELRDAEKALRQSQDYDPKLHAQLNHFYEYGYRYYPGHLRLKETFSIMRETTLSDAKPIVAEPTWDDALHNTFGHLKHPDVPAAGFYVKYKPSKQAATRVYFIVAPEPLEDPVFDDVDGPLVWTGESFESPGGFGLEGMLAGIRDTAGRMRGRLKPETIQRNLRRRFTQPTATWVEFYWDGGMLRWNIGDTPAKTVITMESVGSSD